jgi:hypothetical protein
MRWIQTMLRRSGRKVKNSSESCFSDSVFRQLDAKERSMNVFVTGATGFSEASAKALTAAGARAHIGALEDVESLRKGAAGANAAIHLAFFHKLSHASFSTRLRILLGGSPSGIISRFTAAAVEAERRAIEAPGTSLTGSDRALVVAFPTMVLSPAHLATETTRRIPAPPGASRLIRKGNPVDGFARHSRVRGSASACGSRP